MISSWYLQGRRDVSLHAGDVFQHSVCHFALVSGLAAQAGGVLLQTLDPRRGLIEPEHTRTSFVKQRRPGTNVTFSPASSRVADRSDSRGLQISQQLFDSVFFVHEGSDLSQTLLRVPQGLAGTLLHGDGFRLVSADGQREES